MKQIIDQQHVKAIDTFIKLSKVNPATVDTHIVLGNLFRQRGEIEKAIATHQNVIKKPYLNNHHRANAIFELGRDYFHAGLFDRAEQLFEKAISFGIADIEVNAYRELNTLYEHEKAWENAIEVVEKLQKIAPHSEYTNQIANYYCELADTAFSKGSYQAAQGLLNQAEKLDKNLLRIDLLRGDIETKVNENQGNRKALHYYVRAFRRFPDFGMLILPKIESVLEGANTLEALKHLKDLKPSIISVSYLKTYIFFLLRANLMDEVEGLFLRLREEGSIPLPVLELVLEYQLSQSKIKDETLIQEVVASLRNHNDIRYAYQCSHCGFQSCENYWLCPGCRHWNTITPCDTVSLKPSSNH